MDKANKRTKTIRVRVIEGMYYAFLAKTKCKKSYSEELRRFVQEYII